MNLWVLRPINKWEPWYDKAFAFVVRAESEDDARAIAAKNCGDEGAGSWTNSLRTSCDVLVADGPAEMIVRDYASA